MTVGERLRAWRESAGLKQRAAAKRAGVSQAAWQAVESDNVKRLGLVVAQKIAASTDGAILIEDMVPAESSTSLEDASLHARAAG